MSITNTVFSIHKDLYKLLERGINQARQEERSLLVSCSRQLSVFEPLTYFAAGRQLFEEVLFWGRPSKDFYLVGLGASQIIAAEGKERFSVVKKAWSEILEEAIIENATQLKGTGPLLMGGFNFDPEHQSSTIWANYPDALLVLPKFLLTISQGEYWLTTNIMVEPDSKADQLLEEIEQEWSLIESKASDRSWKRTVADEVELQDDEDEALEWKAAVEQLTEDIKDEQLEKAVLARQVHVKAEQDFSATRILDQLQSQYPTCYIFAVGQGSECFLGATPERLVKFAGDQLQTSCLAGSTARGVSEREDQLLGSRLLNSTKNYHEHMIVLRSIRNSLKRVAAELEIPDQPRLLKLENVQHLHTPVRGRLKDEASLFDVIKELHPTPAVGGLPKKIAIELIRKREGIDRGWYSAPIGWTDVAGDGEFAVAIRSALLEENNAYLYAGCGIVADSEPEDEYQETYLKLKPILSALKGDFNE
ncbi:isochorismate synthase [Natroniella sulfidigena]|uniref:isochorismate synthase n=1 Tax=Natroniella sulfidigena TaxID=723921 RepID=UPI00200B4592|nr:isochorismate synthase [Natroniella sulfidigena]MCK8817888.1 isochorismate synthase [Natroniella sulfidigena]